MKALCWTGVNETSVETVEDPAILNDHDVILRVRLSTTCGSDLHLLGGYIPTMRAGDVLGHEFMGEVVEVGSAVRKHRVGDRVVVCSFIACGQCWYCTHGLFSLCDNGNPNPGLTETMWGSPIGGCFAYSHALGGFAGSHAEYVRVPYADQGAFPVPDGVSDVAALFASDAAPTGWTGADLAGIQPGDTVAVWGAGGVGQMAARAAMLLGAEQVVVIDRLPERLRQVREHIGAETLDYSSESVLAELKERTGGRGPDVCIEAVGMEAHGTGPQYLYDQVKQQLRLQTDRPTALREAIYACRKGGSLFSLGVFGGFVDKFPFGAVMNKGLTVRGAQQHGHRYIPMILDRIAAGEISTEHLATHVMPLEEGPRGYEMFKQKEDGCVRAVFRPGS
ncbi:MULTISPECIES: zinc-dependent alcohol dehydrogenase [unclassified Curtobacterium]|uniref:zinc-dependent alcohol dehydrogenase n=1 Tax=unclassified Curtobacterium TaxID=257496 RepID=UPI00188ACCE6|nr:MULTISPECIES: zinc-dependent alcohol dehydrogenase [unclassified Curtobacterium]MBF4590651.1 glutathione-dependent formaldehyde dehydrogenase [Curtobacterium sp. VKM Ac-1395]MCY1694294.1 glutathione-dependent formaldehyde dehydrogenase [Curtobacterium sp. SL109]